MVLPVIAAAGARVAATTAARAGASTVARTGAKAAARGASTATRKGIESGGRNIIRARRGSVGGSASTDRLASRPGVSRTGNSARGETVTGQVNSEDTESDEEFDDNYNTSTKPDKVHYRIGNFVGLILLLIAAMFDLTELVLDLAGTMLAGVGVVLGYIKDAISLVFFPTVFLFLGAPFWKGRKAKQKVITMLTAFLISAIPWLGAFMPETLIGVAVTIFFTRVEDKGTTVEGEMKSVNDKITRAKRIAARFRR